MSKMRDAATQSKAWPFEEARRILKRFEKNPPEKGYVLFETGYGPSGLPHIGTFGEVARTSMIMRAFQELSDLCPRSVWGIREFRSSQQCYVTPVFGHIWL